MITLERFRALERELVLRGFGPTIEWSETIVPPQSAEGFAENAIYVITNSGLANAVAVPIYERVMVALRMGFSASDVFGHPGKAKAMDTIWRDRRALFEGYSLAENKAGALRALPFIGAVTALHLAKNLGADTAKPDVHIERLARREGLSTEELCSRLSAETGYRVATVDTILWRACADRVLDSKAYEQHGWDGAFNSD